MSEAKLDPRFVISLQGRDYALFAGVLDLAHQQGLTDIETTLIQEPTDANGHTAIVKAKAVFGEDRSFEGLGDANPKNVNARIANACIRMAETRAVGRALRWAVNIGMTLLEELPDLEEEKREYPKTCGAQRAPIDGPRPPIVRHAPGSPEYEDAQAAIECEAIGCDRKLTRGQQAVSVNRYGRTLCLPCQKAARPVG